MLLRSGGLPQSSGRRVRLILSLHIPLAMLRVRSRLSDSGVTVIALAGINLLLLLCLCVLLNTHRLPRYGFNVVPAESQFLLSRFDRTKAHVITITPGEQPRFFQGGHEVKKGLQGLKELFASWDCEAPSHVTVILVCDRAVPAGTLQQVVDMVLSHGFNCSLSGRPVAG